VDPVDKRGIDALRMCPSLGRERGLSQTCKVLDSDRDRFDDPWPGRLVACPGHCTDPPSRTSAGTEAAGAGSARASQRVPFAEGEGKTAIEDGRAA
jgi:hypothetical protein